MRLALFVAVAAGGIMASDLAKANGDPLCFDKATLQYAQCEDTDWTGPYAGAHAGYAWADVDGRFDNLSFEALDVEGPLLGAHLGYQKQYDSGLVLGAELDASLVWAEDDASATGRIFIGDGLIPVVERIKAELNWLASARIRLGLALESVMPYLTGGVALGNFGASASTGAGAFNIDETVVGGVFGGGADVKLDTKWRLGLEALYYAFDKERDLSPPGLAGDEVGFGDVFTLRARLSYRF